MTFKTFIAAVVMASVSGAAVLPAFAQDGTGATPAQADMKAGPKPGGPRDGKGPGMRGHGDMGRKFDFAAVDANGDGKITKEEFDAQRAAKVDALDANKDGMISADELVAMHMKGAQERAEARAKRMIEAHDSNGDGMLSAAELAVRAEPKDMFAMFDADGDGAVTQEEVKAFADKMHERMERRGHDGERGGHGGKPWGKKGEKPDNG